jgi:hypothetical protein
MDNDNHKRYWGVMQASTGEVLDIAYVECGHGATPLTSIHIIVNPAVAQPGNHPNLPPLDSFNLLDNN